MNKVSKFINAKKFIENVKIYHIYLITSPLNSFKINQWPFDEKI